MYTILAWLPGEEKFVAKEDATTAIGLLTPDGFEPYGDWFLGSATLKHHYRRLRRPIQVLSPAASAAVAAALQERE